MKKLLFLAFVAPFFVIAQETPPTPLPPAVKVEPAPKEEVVRPEEFVEYPDTEAEFPGGIAGMQKFIAENIEYPAEAQKNKIQGKVYLSFIITKEGDVSDIKVVRGADILLDRAAKDVIRKMPQWKPATLDDEPVNSKCMLPIVFRL